MPSDWTRIRGAWDPIVRRLGLYTAYRITGHEHVGTTHDLSIDGARDYLRSNGYEPQYLSAAKRHPTTGALHDLSYRRVPGRHPAEASGTALEANYFPDECQYHVHVFEWTTGRVDWFSHYEVRPDFLEPSIDVGRLRTHYRPTYDRAGVPPDRWTYLRGVTDLVLEGTDPDRIADGGIDVGKRRPVFPGQTLGVTST